MGVTSLERHTRPDCNARYDVRIKLVETWLFVCLTWRGDVGRLFVMVLHVVLTPWNPGRWLVESELIQHVFEILDSDWLCDEVTSNTTNSYGWNWQEAILIFCSKCRTWSRSTNSCLPVLNGAQNPLYCLIELKLDDSKFCFPNNPFCFLFWFLSICFLFNGFLR